MGEWWRGYIWGGATGAFGMIVAFMLAPAADCISK